MRGVNGGVHGQGICSLVWPAMAIWITPPQMHISLDELLSAGMFATSTVGAPGAQGAGVLGMQGMGTKVPMAAAVAAATMGLVRLLQTPKGGMFIMALLSMMLPASIMLVRTVLGMATKVEGAAPMEQRIMAPVQTCNGMAWSFPVHVRQRAPRWSVR